MLHFSHSCMHMAAHAYANETGQIFRQKLSLIIFLKLRSRF